MANVDDYNQKLEAIQAIPDEEAQVPTIPVDVYLQEAENLYHWSRDDQEQLATIGITSEQIEDLPVRTGACRETQSIWFKDRYSQQEAQRDWSRLSPQTYDLRNELLHTFRYAYRKDLVILGRISAIAEGDGHADMIQDLNDLAVLGRENQAPLEAIGFDLSKLDLAATKADEMGNLLGLANGDKADQNQSKLLRDKAYTYLKELVDEIRDAGKYLFWRNPQRYQGYISHYRKNRRSTTADEEPALGE